MDILCLAISLAFFVVCLAYVGFLAKEGKIWKT
jgi:D-alanyl-lipoteichoic acid acyltransferase DltB (MBOAT superfamily)